MALTYTSRPMERRPLRAPKGVEDVYGPEAARWHALEDRFFEVCDLYGYRRVRIPVFEDTELFVRGVGEATDVVRKEMYSFTDRGGRSLTLRPEGTAGVVRCFVEHHLDQAGLPQKLAYGGPMFRAENVQRGRQRQFNQLGVEAIGVDDPDLDVEVVALGWRFLADCGLEAAALVVNSIGRPDERAAYIEELRGFVERSGVAIGADDRERLRLNPMRLLDTKDPAVAEVVAGAPRLYDHLDVESKAHFSAVLDGLEALDIPYTVDHGLVRGLDYYTSTTFEYVSTSLEAAQNALGGGGHYDGLVEVVGGPDLPGIGFALGVERILLAMDAESAAATDRSTADVVVLQAGAEDEVASTARGICDALRRAGVRSDRPYGGRSLKAQFKHADRTGARFAVIVGARDLGAGRVTVRDLASGAEATVATDDVVAHVTAATGAERGDP